MQGLAAGGVTLPSTPTPPPATKRRKKQYKVHYQVLLLLLLLLLSIFIPLSRKLNPPLPLFSLFFSRWFMNVVILMVGMVLPNKWQMEIGMSMLFFFAFYTTYI